jgi:hypothetical protein
MATPALLEDISPGCGQNQSHHVKHLAHLQAYEQHLAKCPVARSNWIYLVNLMLRFENKAGLWQDIAVIKGLKSEATFKRNHNKLSVKEYVPSFRR